MRVHDHILLYIRGPDIESTAVALGDELKSRFACSARNQLRENLDVVWIENGRREMRPSLYIAASLTYRGLPVAEKSLVDII